MDPFLRSLSDAEVVELCGGLLDDLASLFHRVALVRGSVPERDPPLPRLLQGLAGLLGNVSRRRRSSCCSTTCISRTRRRGRRCATSLGTSTTLGCWCSRRAAPPSWRGHDVAAQVLFELDQDALLSRLEVAPLARPGVRELTEAVIERPAPRALVDWLSERSQGNPLFAIGLLRALMDERGDLSAPHLRRLPEGLTERVTSELRRFDAAPRGMLERLAVVGRPVSLGDLTALTSSSLEEVGPMLAELVEAGIVVEEERGSELSYELYHPLVRDVIYQATSGATPAGAAPAGGALAVARRAPGGGGAALRPLRRARRLRGGRGAAGRDAPGRAARGVPGGARPAGRARRAAAGRRPALARGARGDVRARGVADRPPRRDERPGRDQGAAGDRRPARGLLRPCPAGDRQVPAGQLPRLGNGRPRAGVRRLQAGARPVRPRRRPAADAAGEPASSRGSRACRATLRAWAPTPGRWSRRPTPSTIGSSRCRAWPRSATAPTSAAPSPRPRPRSGARRRSPARTTRRIASRSCSAGSRSDSRCRDASPRPPRCSTRRRPPTRPTARASWSSWRRSCAGSPATSRRRGAGARGGRAGSPGRRRGGGRSAWCSARWPRSSATTSSRPSACWHGRRRPTAGGTGRTSCR